VLLGGSAYATSGMLLGHKNEAGARSASLSSLASCVNAAGFADGESLAPWYCNERLCFMP
jgi:hypothetical protein